MLNRVFLSRILESMGFDFPLPPFVSFPSSLSFTANTRPPLELNSSRRLPWLETKFGEAEQREIVAGEFIAFVRANVTRSGVHATSFYTIFRIYSAAFKGSE